MAITSFIPELWSARLLYNLEKAHVATNLVNRDYEGDIRGAGDTVHINTLGDITVKDYKANMDMDDPEELSTEDQILLINQAKSFNFQVDDLDAAQAAGNLVDTATQRASYALADVSDAFILGTLAAGGSADNYVGTANAGIALTGANVYENIIKLRTALDKANVPTAGRTIVIPPEVYALLLLDDRFTRDDATAENTIVNGLVGRVAGFDVYESNNVVKSAGGVFSITAQIADACTYAEQITKIEAYRLEKRFADGVKGLHVYGAKVTRPSEVATLFATV